MPTHETEQTSPDIRSQRADAEPDAPVNHAPNAAALLPQELLQPGELIILLLKPSLLYVLLAPLKTLVLIALITAGAAHMATYPALRLDRDDVILLGVGLAMMRIFWQFLEWLSRVYVLTDRRIIRVKGVLRVQVFEAALKQVTHTECHFSLRERLFGLGTISFATAGTAIVEAYWLMLPRPLEVHQTILQTMNRYR